MSFSRLFRLCFAFFSSYSPLSPYIVDPVSRHLIPPCRPTWLEVSISPPFSTPGNAVLPLHYLVHYSADVPVLGEGTRGGWGTVRKESKPRTKNRREVLEIGARKYKTWENRKKEIVFLFLSHFSQIIINTNTREWILDAFWSLAKRALRYAIAIFKRVWF